MRVDLRSVHRELDFSAQDVFLQSTRKPCYRRENRMMRS